MERSNLPLCSVFITNESFVGGNFKAREECANLRLLPTTCPKLEHTHIQRERESERLFECERSFREVVSRGRFERERERSFRERERGRFERERSFRERERVHVLSTYQKMIIIQYCTHATLQI